MQYALVELLYAGKLFDEFLEAVAGEGDDELGVLAVAFAAHYCALAVFGVHYG